MNHSRKDGLFELTGIGSPLKGRLVMNFIIFPTIEIVSSSQIFSSWYQLNSILEASSFKFSKLSIMGALREVLILVA